MSIRQASATAQCVCTVLSNAAAFIPGHKPHLASVISFAGSVACDSLWIGSLCRFLSGSPVRVSVA